MYSRSLSDRKYNVDPGPHALHTENALTVDDPISVNTCIICALELFNCYYNMMIEMTVFDSLDLLLLALFPL